MRECPKCGTLLALGAGERHEQWHKETAAPPGEPEKANQTEEDNGQGE